ncbi:MAG: ABC transporter ATP-binding protein [Verrucomicrobia bacterium]|nr:ABC transporter ATP-binding protein [Verrucomicrobiota bacterium]
MARVVIEHLDKTFLGPKKEEIPALKDLSLYVEDKELLVLVGPSGCGKTTLLRTIAGLEEPTRGGISIDGQMINRVPAKDRDVAMVFQNYALYPHMTVFENMAFGLKLRKYAKPEIEARVAETAALLGLQRCLDRRPGALSGGERQRVALGRAIVHKPKVFLLDEPLSNLDAALRAQMRVELARLHTRLGVTMIYVTHDQVEAMTLGHRIAVLNEGRIQQVAEPLELYRRPGNLFVAGFIGSPPMNFIRGELLTKSGGCVFATRTDNFAAGLDALLIQLPPRFKTALGQVERRAVVLGVRPEDIGLQPVTSATAGRSDGVAAIQAAVEVVEPRGPETYLFLSAGAQTLTARVAPDFPCRPGQTVAVSFAPEKAHLFDANTEEVLDPSHYGLLP